MKRIKVVEDDEALREELSILLERNGFITVKEEPYDLVILDVNLPGESGFSLCRRLREKSKVPVIFLTARNTPEDELLGFAVGGDDYVYKPFNSAVLIARIERLLKSESHDPTVKGLTVKKGEMKAEYKDKEVDLTRNEMRILLSLIKRGLATRDEIVEDLWSEGIYVDDNTLYITQQAWMFTAIYDRLREKLSQIGAGDFIETVRGVGYRI